MVINEEDIKATELYGCATGELTEEATGKSKVEVSALLYEMLYEGQWWRQRRHDTTRFFPLMKLTQRP